MRLTKRGRDLAVAAVSLASVGIVGTLLEWNTRPEFPLWLILVVGFASFVAHMMLVCEEFGEPFIERAGDHKPRTF